jgi:hypothetical protein
MGQVETSKKPPKPPQPPQISRRVRFHPTQAIGMPLFLLLPLFALLGVLQTHSATKEISANGLALSVEYPDRLRFRTGIPLELSVRNDTGRPLAGLKLKLSRGYVSAFDNPEFDPGPLEIDEEFVVFEFKDIEAGETRRAQIEIEADQAGTHKARVLAQAKGGASAETEFATFVLP